MKTSNRLELLEAIWDPEQDERAFLGALAGAFARAVPGLLAPTAFHGVVEDMRMRMIAAAAPPKTDHMGLVLGAAAKTPPQLIMKTRQLGQTGLLVFRHADAPETGGLDQASPTFRLLGGSDAFTLGVRDGRGETICLTGVMPERRPLPERERAAWHPVSAHLGAALRLRQRGVREAEQADAIFDARGRLLHRNGWSGGLVDHVDPSLQELVDRVRSHHVRPSRRDAEWVRALYDGRWSVVRRQDVDGAVRFLAVRNPIDGAPMRRLDPAELRVITAMLGDEPVKALADELGISEATFSRRATSALRKLGVRSRGELILVVGAVATLGIAPSGETFAFVWDLQHLLAARGLTPAESALVPLLVTGCSDARIAAARGTAPRTIANQCASIYRKLGVSTRHELAVAVLRAFLEGRRKD